MANLRKILLLLFCLVIKPQIAFAFGENSSAKGTNSNEVARAQNLSLEDSQTPHALVKAAKERTKHKVTYDGAYISIPYPNGDVPANIGVCTDVIIRSYRKLGIDLQRLVHEDMTDSFADYPNIWGLKRPDKNIDHRRVPNLQTFFNKYGVSLPISTDPSKYKPGDMVTWMLPGNLPHIGIVSDMKSIDGERYLILHNIGFGPKQDDFLFGAKITGHYRYYPEGQ